MIDQSSLSDISCLTLSITDLLKVVRSLIIIVPHQQHNSL